MLPKPQQDTFVPHHCDASYRFPRSFLIASAVAILLGLLCLKHRTILRSYSPRPACLDHAEAHDALRGSVSTNGASE